MAVDQRAYQVSWNRIKSVLQTASITLLWMGLATLLWMIFGPIQPAITIDETRSLAWETTTTPGGRVSRTLVFTANMDVTLHTYRRLVELDCNKCRTYELEPAQRNYSAGQTYIQSRAVMIPEHVLPGRYRMEVEGVWRPNPFREGRIQIPPFVITVVSPILK